MQFVGCPVCVGPGGVARLALGMLFPLEAVLDVRAVLAVVEVAVEVEEVVST